MMTVSQLQIKAESLFINSIGHRPMEYVAPPYLSGCRPDIKLITPLQG